MTKTLGGIAIAVLITALAACGSSHHSSANPTTLVPTGAVGAVSSAAANPTVSAEAVQAKALVKSCFAGTPLQQLHQVHLVFLSSASGKNGAAVTQARDTTFTCLGIPKDKRQAFVNDAITAAEHANPKLTTHAGRVNYLEVTLPQLVLKYKGQAGYTPPASPGAGTVPGTAPSPSA